jgi:hypothetical protein
MSKFVFGASYGARLITQTTPPLPSFKHPY